MQHKKVRFGIGFKVTLSNRRSQAAQMVLKPGQKEGDPSNRHRGADQWLFVLSGQGRAVINGKKYSLAGGDLFLIEKGDRHEILNTGTEPLKTLNFYVPPAYTNAGNELSPGKR